MDTDYYPSEIEENIEDLPQEVRDFIFGEGMQSVRVLLGAQLQDQDLLERLCMSIELFLFGIEGVETMEACIDALPIEEIKKETIKTIIQKHVIEELILLVEVREELTLEKQGNDLKKEEKIVFANLKSKLSQATTIAPIIRPRASVIEKKPLFETPTHTEEKRDPYREIPEEK